MVANDVLAAGNAVGDTTKSVSGQGNQTGAKQ